MIKLGKTNSNWRFGPNAHVKYIISATFVYNWHEESESFDSVLICSVAIGNIPYRIPLIKRGNTTHDDTNIVAYSKTILQLAADRVIHTLFCLHCKVTQQCYAVWFKQLKCCTKIVHILDSM